MLHVQALAVAYGAIQAVRGIDLHLQPGELVALIGTNGAGKTTTLKALAGLLPAQGQVHFQQQNLLPVPAHQRLQLGLALVPEGRGVFSRLTVEENLLMGAYIHPKAEWAAGVERCYTIFPRLKERRHQLAGTLSGGEQQMLAMGRALMGRPSLLLLDEPSMGLAPMMVDKVMETILAIHASGVAVLLVEQNARLALRMAERAYVLESGAITLHGSGHELLHHPAVRQAYLGEDAPEPHS